jgi:hypothetical protein
VLLPNPNLHYFRNVFVCWKLFIINIMSSPTKRGATQNPRDVDQGLRSSTRTNKEQPVEHARKTEIRQTKRSISSRDTKMPKIIKSASSIKKQRLDILLNHKKDYPTVTKSHQDSHSNVTAITVNCQLKHHFGVLQTYHQELKSFLK